MVITNSGSASDAVLDFTIPRGDTGASGAGTGDVVGPESAANNGVALFNGTTGKLVKDGGVLGTAAFSSASSFATATQGTKADTAVQPGSLGTAAGFNVPVTGNAVSSEVVKGNDTRLTDARPASDVSAWAKAATKPTYTKSEVGLGNVDNTSDASKSVLSATKLTTARTINGVAFDGTANITVADSTKLPLAGGVMTGTISFAAGQTWPTFNQSTTGNAATATKLSTARTINGVSFDGSANISVSVDWSSVTGKPAVIAAGADAAAARAAIGAGDVTQTGTQTLTNKTIHGNVNTLTVDGTNEVGFRNIPQNSQSAAYTLVLADAGKHILHPAADTTARTFTIPANSSLAFPIGTAITFINQNGTGGVVTIAITTDTMRLAGAGTTGSRTLARNGVATAIKITATEWIISGTGLT